MNDHLLLIYSIIDLTEKINYLLGRDRKGFFCCVNALINYRLVQRERGTQPECRNNDTETSGRCKVDHIKITAHRAKWR